MLYFNMLIDPEKFKLIDKIVLALIILFVMFASFKG